MNPCTECGQPTDEPGGICEACMEELEEAMQEEELTEESCHGHIASADNPKVCARCGTHIDSLRPLEDDE